MVVERDILCLEVFSILLWKSGEPNPNGWVRDVRVRAEKAKVEKGLWADIDQNHPLFFPPPAYLIHASRRGSCPTPISSHSHSLIYSIGSIQTFVY